jgi:hypothetical protein
MARFRIRVTGQLTLPTPLDSRRIRAITGGSVKCMGVDLVQFTVTRSGSDAQCAAERALTDIQRALAPDAALRHAVWTARKVGVAGLRRVSTGQWPDDDDGLAGVREPRRPLPSAGSAAVTLDEPAA